MLESLHFKEFNHFRQPYGFLDQNRLGKIATTFPDQITKANTYINSFNSRSRPVSPDLSSFQTKTKNINARANEIVSNLMENKRHDRTCEAQEINDFEENITFLRSQVFEFVKASAEQNKMCEEKIKQNLVRNQIIKGVLKDIFYSFEQNGFITLQTARSILIYLNERFKIPYTKTDIEFFFMRVKNKYQGLMDFNEFCKAFEIF